MVTENNSPSAHSIIVLKVLKQSPAKEVKNNAIRCTLE